MGVTVLNHYSITGKLFLITGAHQFPLSVCLFPLQSLLIAQTTLGSASQRFQRSYRLGAGDRHALALQLDFLLSWPILS